MGSGPGRETVINGRKCLYFGGTGYYGLQAHPDLIAAGQRALEQYGTCSATSRDIYGTTPLHLEVERTAARFFDTEDAIYLPSGYLVNIAGFQALAQRKQFDAVFLDELAHWSIADFVHALQKPVFPFAHRDPEDLRRHLETNLAAGQKPLVASDGIFPTFGKIAPVPEYLRAVEPYDGSIWLDDCHAIGVLGQNGRGTSEHYGLESARLHFGGTLSKAIGAHGGIIPGKTDFIQAIREGHIANGANASPSPAAAAAVAGMTLLMSRPEMRHQLWRNARQLKDGLRNLGFEQDDSPVPVGAFVLKTAAAMDHVHEELLKRDICIQRTRYVGAGPDGALRTVVFATHSEQDIERLLAELRSLL